MKCSWLIYITPAAVAGNAAMRLSRHPATLCATT